MLRYAAETSVFYFCVAAWVTKRCGERPVGGSPSGVLPGRHGPRKHEAVHMEIEVKRRALQGGQPARIRVQSQASHRKCLIGQHKTWSLVRHQFRIWVAFDGADKDRAI